MFDFTFQAPTTIHFGRNKIRMLPGELKKHASKILLVYGLKSIKTYDIYQKVIAYIERSKIEYCELGGILPNPRLEKVYEGINICKKEGVDFILAVGGGSVIDSAKAIAAGTLHDGNVWDFFTEHTGVRKALKIGTILTNAASGSEMNGNMVITNALTKEKRSTSSPVLIPQFSILNPEYTYSVDAGTTAAGIADIVSHVIESYISPIPNAELQNNMAAAILKTIIHYAPIVMKEPRDYAARSNIMWSSTLALNGLTSRGKLADWSCHAIEHELSGLYDIPHGVGLAILLPKFLRVLHNAENEATFLHYARHVWSITETDPERSILSSIDALEDFFKMIGLPNKLSALNITDENFELIARNAVKIRGEVRHYRQLTEMDILHILRLAL